MPDWLFFTLAFGTGPAAAVLLLWLDRRRRHREDVAAWERGQELRRRLRATPPTPQQIAAAGEKAMRSMPPCPSCGMHVGHLSACSTLGVALPDGAQKE